jgi:hypothetical protein
MEKNIDDKEFERCDLEKDEKEMMRYDDWHSKAHEKHREKDHLYRETELHGVVGKEIHDALELEKKRIAEEKKKEEKEKQDKYLENNWIYPFKF